LQSWQAHEAACPMVRLLFISMLRATVEEMKPVRVAYLGAVILTLVAAAIAQEYSRAELGLDYSYAGYAPSASYTQGHGMNHGGGPFQLNLSPYFGILADLQGYASNQTSFAIPLNAFFPGGGSANRTSCTRETINFPSSQWHQHPLAFRGPLHSTPRAG